VKRAAVLAAVLAALAAAASANAKIPPVKGGSVIGRNLPLKVFASLNPPVHVFGTAVTAKVAVVADRKWVAAGEPAGHGPLRPVPPGRASDGDPPPRAAASCRSRGRGRSGA
jgi:hypothetical protein